MSYRRTALVAAAVAALAVAVPGIATGDDGRDGYVPDLLRSGLVGSTPLEDGGPALFGVDPGGLPWVADATSTVRVRRDGRVDIRVGRLVIPTPPFNGTNPVPSVAATLFCGRKAVGTTPTATLSVPRGDARIRARLQLPRTCEAPVVLLNPGGDTSVYIAVNG